MEQQLKIRELERKMVSERDNLILSVIYANFVCHDSFTFLTHFHLF